MTYFLDFDRTLFDTSSFLDYIIKEKGMKDLASLSDVEQAIALDKLVAEGKMPPFSPGELERFMYGDAVVFLKKHAGSCVVVTAGNPSLQKNKLENAFAGDSSVKVFYAGWERKGPFMSEFVDSYPKPWIFVDDKATELESVSQELPEVSLFQMCRDELEPHGAYPALRSFADLP